MAADAEDTHHEDKDVILVHDSGPKESEASQAQDQATQRSSGSRTTAANDSRDAQPRASPKASTASSSSQPQSQVQLAKKLTISKPKDAVAERNAAAVGVLSKRPAPLPPLVKRHSATTDFPTDYLLTKEKIISRGLLMAKDYREEDLKFQQGDLVVYC